MHVAPFATTAPASGSKSGLPTAQNRAALDARHRLERIGARLARAVSWAGGGLLLAAGCSAYRGPIGVIEVEPERAFRAITSSALDSKDLSAATRGVLQYFDLLKLHDKDPDAALKELHARAVAEPAHPVVFALAEVCYLSARLRGDRDRYLASAVYAYLFLLGIEHSTPISPYDRRFRWACDIYGSGLLQAFVSADGRHFVPETGTRELPIGSLRIAVDREDLPAQGRPGETVGPDERLDFLPADRFLPRGLDLRLRDSGVGVPLIGVYPRPKQDTKSLLQFGGQEIPATAFLRVRGSLAELEGGIDAALELHSGFESASVSVDGATIPLETDRTVFLAHVLDRAEVWDFDLEAFFAGDNARSTNKLILVQPYRRGRCPVVFVHGTASNPAYWADMFNSLWSDPELRQGAQFWFFKYTTGNPLGYSGADLREALHEVVAKLDPDGTDAALRNMVVVGHSQGGLLAKLMVVGGRLQALEDVSGIPLEELDLTPAQDKLLRRMLEYDPVPTVKRAVFLSTPHRGSFQATRWYSRLLTGVISLPSDIVDLGKKLTAKEEHLPRSVLERLPTSLDNMDKENPFLQHLLKAEVAPNVSLHSIIAIGECDPNDAEALSKTDDGVVEYTSAHIDGVASELLVAGNHSSQLNPAAIHEVRRILLEHVRAASGTPKTPAR